MSSEITSFLKEAIYPSLDAVEVGLLDDLNPKKKGGGGRLSYEVDCPACGTKGRAFYYPGGQSIMCNRQNNCGVKTSIWDYMLKTGYANNEIPQALSRLVGIPLPNAEPDSVTTANKKLSDLLLRTLKYSLTKNKRAITYLKEVRGWSDEEIEAAPIGFVYKWEYIYDAIAKFDGDIGLLSEWGLYEPDSARRDRTGLNDFEGRIVGLWEQPDESVRAWGRLIRDPREGEDKYKYQSGMVKDIPAYANHDVSRSSRENVVAVEGMLDVSRLIANGVPSIGIGGSSVSSGQVAFMAKRYKSIVHWIDLDEAGLKGATLTIQKLSCAGVRGKVFHPEADLGIKDADESITRFGFNEAIEKFVSGLVSDTEFLGLRLKWFLGTNPDNANLYQHINRLSSSLCGEVKFGFDLAVKDMGITPPSPEIDAFKTVIHLYENGATLEEALRIAKRKTGVAINVEL